jgi:hypothetical protein
VRLGGRPIAALAVLCAVAFSGCGDTLQDQPIPHDILEGLLIAPRPVYWLGGSFQGMAITEAVRDPGGAYSVRYGDCLRGGQSSCVAPVRVVTSPDNSFLPGGSAPHREARIRGVAALVAQGGQTIEIPTGRVVIGIYAQSPRLADAAAQTLVPINAAGAPGAPLPPRLPDTGFAMRPLPSQVPPLLRVPR